MFLKGIKKVLILAPHTDDGEFGCGGTIVKLLEEGAEVHYVAFSACEKSVLPEFPSDILVKEVHEATKVLGISKKNLHILKYDVRTFNYRRQEILDDILDFKKEINPDLVLIPSLNDLHQDHSTIAIEAIRAFKFTNILSYEIPWNNFSFSTTSFFVLTEKHIQIKVKALEKYKSQKHRIYANEEFIKSLARTRGVQIGEKYAEVFEVIRLVG
jgi:LmbE family N-acetylglucosaminyl deacetylase